MILSNNEKYQKEPRRNIGRKVISICLWTDADLAWIHEQILNIISFYVNQGPGATLQWQLKITHSPPNNTSKCSMLSSNQLRSALYKRETVNKSIESCIQLSWHFFLLLHLVKWKSLGLVYLHLNGWSISVGKKYKWNSKWRSLVSVLSTVWC